MEGFLSPLYELPLRGGMISSATVPLYLPVFGAGCALTALMMLFLDLCVFVVRGWSFLRSDHSRTRTIYAAVFMPAAAGIVGMTGLAIDLPQPGRSACIAVGIAWPSLMTVLIGAQEPKEPRADSDEVDDPRQGEEGEELIE